ncbi:MAG: cupredoxin domain-containing protein [Alphaproteobacteria bacterium]|nr:cupredoxin domain-containing protein [Alphaproteobacteria bacterium]
MHKTAKILAAAIFFLALTTLQAMAAQEYTITIKDHKFSPETLQIPAGEKVKLTIVNNDPSPEEFESYELNREKIIGGNSKGVVFIGPLEPGSYPYFGEFNMDTAKGTIVAK